VGALVVAEFVAALQPVLQLQLQLRREPTEVPARVAVVHHHGLELRVSSAPIVAPSQRVDAAVRIGVLGEKVAMGQAANCSGDAGIADLSGGGPRLNGWLSGGQPLLAVGRA
jgi:hypothetical protein